MTPLRSTLARLAAALCGRRIEGRQDGRCRADHGEFVVVVVLDWQCLHLSDEILFVTPSDIDKGHRRVRGQRSALWTGRLLEGLLQGLTIVCKFV